MNTRLTVAAALATVLASIALYPLLAEGTWFWGGVGAVIVVAAVGAATRRRAIPAILCFLAAVGAVLLYLNAVFASRQSWAGLVPTAASLHHLQVLLHQAMAETSKYAPPVPSRPGIVLLTVAGIGLVAVLTDLLAVRLHRPAIAGLPLLVLFCVPLTTDARPGAVGGTLVFCAGMVGYLGLLSADGRHRLRLWGRLIHPWQDDADSQGPDVRPLAAAGRRIGSAAVVLALALPLLVPGLKAHRLFPGDGTGKGGGGSHGKISFPKPLDLLNTDLRETHPVSVLTYHTVNGTPPYLQVYVLGNLTTNAWTMGQAPATTGLTRKGFMPVVPGMASNTPGPLVREWINLGTNLTNRGNVSYLPLPYAARQVKVSGGSNWRIDPNTLSVLSPSAKLAGLHYEALAKDVNPLPQSLRGLPIVTPSSTGYLNVPPQYRTKKIMKLVRRITSARSTPYGKAVAIQAWFTAPGHFTYSLKVSQKQSPAALINFLTKSKMGYCQQFAFAMAVLARLVGIPSRVVVGYTQGTFIGNDNWQVKTSDAHAWPELLFPRAGWLRFEPTPPDSAGQAGQATAIPPPYSTPLADQPNINPQTGQPVNNNGNQGSTQQNKGQSSLNKLKKAPGGLGGATASRHHGTPPFVPVIIALLVVLLIAPATTRVVGRRWRWWRAQDDVSRAHVAWHELRHDLTDYRIPYRDSESPRALTRRIATSLGLAGAERDALERIALAEERASYAISPADSARLQADEALVRRAVARSGAASARWLAIIAPPSALIPVRAGAQQLLDVFGWMELATTGVRRRVSPPPDLPVIRTDKPAPA
ncbi:MAG TPA: transglutaminaseTgpA domain-containing protein [Streptosporangiaceae bacterium]|nr:transglutaminaseTgpA domain-containing protein [Streptosporangiaceae bacterium]